MPYRIPSHVTRNNGCARKRSEAKYRNLWPGFAWSPCLGNTGATQREHIQQADGTLTNMVPADDWVLSEGRWALNYGGTNQFVEVAENPALEYASGTQKTVSVRFRLANTTGVHTIVSKWDNPTDKEYILYSNGTSLFLGCNGESTEVTTTVAASTWYHAVFTLSGAGASELFLDGVSAGTGSATVFATGNVNALRFGQNTATNWFAGLIDDVLMWNRIVPAQEIRQLYSLGRGGWAERRKRRTWLGDPGYTPFAEFHNQSQPIFDKYVPVPY